MKNTNLNFKIERQTHQIDAASQTIGRLATQIVNLLTGKNKINFSKQIDNGGFVIVSNIDKVKFSGKKLEQKKYFEHSGRPGGLKTIKMSDLAQKTHEILERAVWKMLPKNRARKDILKRLTFK